MGEKSKKAGKLRRRKEKMEREEAVATYDGTLSQTSGWNRKRSVANSGPTSALAFQDNKGFNYDDDNDDEGPETLMRQNV